MAASNAMPVILPPGWARLCTSPMSTGAPTDQNTVGTCGATFFAATAEIVPPTTRMSMLGASALIAPSTTSDRGATVLVMMLIFRPFW